MKTTRLLLGTIALLGACARATSAPIEARVDQTVDLATGEAARVENSVVVVRFGGAADSRCPSDVVCVTAGDAVVTLLMSGAGADRTDVVNLVKEPRSTTYGGFRFEAVGLAPYPKSTAQTTDKTLTLRITKAP